MKVEDAFLLLKQQEEEHSPTYMIDAKNRRWRVCKCAEGQFHQVPLQMPLEGLSQNCNYRILKDEEIVFLVFSGMDDGRAYVLLEQELAKRKQNIK
jgi:hypothetical protein